MKRFALLGLLLLALVGCFCFKRPTLETSLFALVGEEQINLSPEILQRGNCEIQVLFFAKTLEEALPVAEAFEARLPKSAFKTVRFKLDGALTQTLLDAYQANPSGLLAPKDAQLLESGAYERIRKQAVRKWHTALLPLFPLEGDPFYLLNGFITSRTLALSGWHAELNGVLTKPTEEGIALLLSLSLWDTIASNPDALVPIVQGLQQSATELKTEQVEISLSGVPLHTVEVAGKCKAEITWLSFFSVLVILLVAWKAFHSFRVYPYLLFILTFSGGVGALCTMLCCSKIHLLACVFATTLLGLTIDYAFHGLLAKDPQAVRKNLLFSWITTELSLLPLLFSGIPILVQSSIFMMTGLAATLCMVYRTLSVATTPPVATTVVQVPRCIRILKWLLPVLFLVLLPCLAMLQFGTNLQAIHAPSQQLLEAEKRFRDLTFPDQQKEATGLLIVEGETLEALLQREAALDLPLETARISHFLPPLAVRQKAYQSLQDLYRTQGDALMQSLGLLALLSPLPPQPWTEENVPALYLDNFILRTANGRYLTLLPNQPPPATLGEGCFYTRPQQAMQQTIDRLSCITQRLLAIIGGCLLVLLIVIFKKRAWKIALPPLLAVCVVFLCFGTGGRTINLFHLLACFMLIGMSLDYTIFFASGERHALKPVTCSFLTSLAGFGALALVSFMVVRSIGQVFAIGLAVSYCSAYLLFYGEPAPTPQHPKTEKAATLLGMNVLLYGYRLFGKGFLDAMGVLLAWTLWIASPSIRTFTGSRQRLMAFIQSMIDKVVVMSCGRGQPTIEVATDADTQAFITAVTSRQGVFLLSSHFGAMEVLPALPSSAEVPLHAFMHIEQTAIFNRFYFKLFKRPSVHIRPVAGFGMGELFEAGTYLDQGDCVLMAGDRAFGSSQTVTFLGQQVAFPKGVYRFAKLLEHPIYFVVCYRIGKNRYRLEAREIIPNDTMVEQFIAALEPFVKAHPEQWYHWEIQP